MTKFSGVHQFKQGQYVTVAGAKGITEGVKSYRSKRGSRQRRQRVVAVRITDTAGAWSKGTIVYARPASVQPRRGHKGTGVLTPIV